jgi:hypothetical protein
VSLVRSLRRFPIALPLTAGFYFLIRGSESKTASQMSDPRELFNQWRTFANKEQV